MRAFGDNFSIKERHGIIKRNNDGSTLELRTVSWYGRPAKLDIRSWNGDELAKSDAKLLLTTEDALELYYLLDKIFKKDTTTSHPTVQNHVNTDYDNTNPILSEKITIWD